MTSKPAQDFQEEDFSLHLEDKVNRRTFLLGIATLMCSTLSLPAEATVGLYEPFSFAVISDIHLATGLPDSYILTHESQLFLQETIKTINSEKLDFVIFVGDQVENLGKDLSNWQLFVDVAQGLNVPWSFVVGEHDISDSLPTDKMQTFGPDWKNHGIETKTPYWSQSPLPGIHIVGLDTSQPNSSEGYVSSKQLDWLRGDLEANKRKFTIIFSHHPLLPPPPYDGGPPWDEFILPQGPAVREILGSFPKVRLAISGHVHVSHVQQEKDIWYVACPSLSVYPCAFRIFRITPENITIETYSVNFPALVKKARKMLDSSTLAYKYDGNKPQRFATFIAGENLDNNVLLPLALGAHPQPLSKKKRKKQAESQAQMQGKRKKKAKPKTPETRGEKNKEDPSQKTQDTTTQGVSSDRTNVQKLEP